MKKFLLIMLSLMLVFSFSACGGNGNENGGEDVGGEDVEIEEEIGDVELPDTLVCGVTEFEPMNYREDGTTWTGFDTEFALLVGDRLGMDVEFQEIDWIQKYAELASGAITCIWNGFTANATEEDGTPRIELVDMSYAYLLNQQCVVVKAENAGDYTDIGDLSGKSVAAEEGSAGQSLAAEAIGDYGSIFGTAAQINTFIEVKSGAVDCAVVDILLAEKIAGSGDYEDLVIADIVLDYEVYAVGFKKGDPLRDAVNAAMEELYDDGTLAGLAEKYGLENSLILNKTI